MRKDKESVINLLRISAGNGAIEAPDCSEYTDEFLRYVLDDVPTDSIISTLDLIEDAAMDEAGTWPPGMCSECIFHKYLRDPYLTGDSWYGYYECVHPYDICPWGVK